MTDIQVAHAGSVIFHVGDVEYTGYKLIPSSLKTQMNYQNWTWKHMLTITFMIIIPYVYYVVIFFETWWYNMLIPCFVCVLYTHVKLFIWDFGVTKYEQPG